MKDKWGLVLEGGGMRGVFTAGALEAFLDENLEFPYVIGVSAGASNGLSYASGQKGRAKISNIDLLVKYKYISLLRLLTRGEVMDFDLLFDEFPNKILPYDFDAYSRFCESGRKFTIVASNCLTGKAEYFVNPKAGKHLLEVCRASCSMPLVSKICLVGEKPMLDGGICDPIPFRRAKSDGIEKIVAVLTRNFGYRKGKFLLPPWSYRKYPEIRRALAEKSSIYNDSIEEMEEMESRGEAVVIRPVRPLEIDRLERSPKKLLELYEHGYECAKNKMKEIFSFLK